MLISALLLISSLGAVADTNNLTADLKITVKGLDSGDSVKFVKIIKWVDGEGWAYTDEIKSGATSANVSLPDIKEIIGTLTKDEDGKYVPGKITAANGGIFGQAATKAISSATTVNAVADPEVTGKYKAELAKGDSQADMDFVGLYVAMIAPGTPDYNYNPVFVAADWSQASTSPNYHTIDLNISYSDTALAKKNQVTLTKTSGTGADVQYDVAVGDEIPFTVTSQIPAFSTSYINPTYEITDTLSAGLQLKGYDSDSKGLTVKIGGQPATITTDYTVTATATGYTLNVTQTKLRTLEVATAIEITYAATVETVNDAVVDQKTNTATVKFSNKPHDANSFSKLEDKTNHYTFSIDANAIGNENYQHSEVIKIGVDKDGNELTQNVTEDNQTKAHALQGAQFKLYTKSVDPDTQAETFVPYTNKLYDANTVFTSLEDGRILIQGLDVGTYYLEEIKAPAGYIKPTDKVEIVISATYEEIPAGHYTDDDGIEVYYDKYDVLKSYTVTVNGSATTTMANQTVSTYTLSPWMSQPVT